MSRESKKRAYGTGSLSPGPRLVVRQVVGRESAGRRLGRVRQAGEQEALTRKQAESALRRMMGTVRQLAPRNESPSSRQPSYIHHIEPVMRRKPSTVVDYRVVANPHLGPRATPRNDALGLTDHALYMLAAVTGLRQGELVALRWRDIDWSEWGTPKPRRSSRAVPLAGLRASSSATSSAQATGATTSSSSRTRSPGTPMTPRGCASASTGDGDRRDGTPARAPGRITFHSLRHTFGTRMAAVGVYSDGNGRIGRLVVIVQLLRSQIIREPLLVVSPWFEQRRDQYQDALLELSCTGDWDAWLRFFVDGVAASAAESERKVEALVELRKSLRGRVQSAGKRGVSEQVAADLVGQPYVTVPAIARLYGVTDQGAAKVIKTLVGLEILQPIRLRAPHGAQMYGAREVLAVLS